VFLQDIANVEHTNVNDEYLENLATFLQSIDSDAGDNIVITDETRAALVDSYLDLKTASEEEVKAFVENIGQTYVDEDTAMEHVQDMLEEYAGIDAIEFDERVSDDVVVEDSVKIATLGTEAIVGVSYTTSSGLEGVTDENGMFTYAEDDVISFLNASGEVISELDSSTIGDDELITLNELDITIDDVNSEVVEETDEVSDEVIPEEESEDEIVEEIIPEEGTSEGDESEVEDIVAEDKEAEVDLGGLSLVTESTAIDFNKVSEIEEDKSENEESEKAENIANPLEIPNLIPGTEETEKEETSLSDNFVQTDGNAQIVDTTVQVKIEQPISDGVTN